VSTGAHPYRCRNGARGYLWKAIPGVAVKIAELKDKFKSDKETATGKTDSEG